jgi:hypothetical protein
MSESFPTLSLLLAASDDTYQEITNLILQQSQEQRVGNPLNVVVKSAKDLNASEKKRSVKLVTLCKGQISFNAT